jgi:DNA-directed RNA polymerase subunit RPC12/RpoP
LRNPPLPSISQSIQISAVAALQCPKCGSERVRRIERKGILERRLFKFFGYFPWRCATCRDKFFLKRRSRDGGKPPEYAG